MQRLRDLDGPVDHGSSSDQAERLVAELERRVLVDGLTQLPSKARMEAWLADAPPGTLLALVDVDDFRLLNQTLGHDFGDEALVVMAQRLSRHCPPPEHRVARISQDEFAVLGPAGESPEALAARIGAVFDDPFTIAGRKVRLHGTCGISRTRGTDGPAGTGAGGGSGPNEVIREADSAMYEAKSVAKGGHVVFHDDLHRRAASTFEIAQGLREALSDHQLGVWFQPEVALSTGALHGAEALLRWFHPRHGQVSPGTFIPVAETTDLIEELGRFALRTALEQRRAWVADGVVDDGFVMAVNLSVRQLDDPGVVDLVADLLERTGCPPGALCLELTESAVMSDPERAADRLAGLAGLGVHLAVDDFGTGYSSLSYLQQLPIGTLKIDRTFIADCGDERGRKLTSAILGVAEALDLATVAEGIETPEQLEHVRSQGCDVGQGYLLARPEPPERFAAVLSQATGRVGSAPVSGR